VKVFVVRHAHAGDRSRWEGDDRLRPLSGKGRRQVGALTERLEGEGVELLLSSPYVRCVDTLRPLADRLGIEVDSDPRLAEGTGDAAWELAGELASDGRNAVLCSHGDVIPALLRRWAVDGVDFSHGLTWPKASTWVLSGRNGMWARADYEPPPGRAG
jgi:broad specificity phosphatase PhoE